MIVFGNNFFLVAPLAVALWALDAYLLAVALRVSTGQLAAVIAATWFMSLQHLTDGVPHRIDRWFRDHRQTGLASWVPWVIVIVAGVLVRPLLALGIVALSQTGS